MTPLKSCIAILFLTSLCAVAQEGAKPAAAQARAPITQGQRIYAAHHSYFIAIPSILSEMAVAAGIKDQPMVGNRYIGGSKSMQHWNLLEPENKAKAALAAGALDVLALTPVYLPDEGVEQFATFGLEHNPKLRVTVMEFWLPYDEYQPHYYDAPKIPHPAKVDHNAQTVAGLVAMHDRYFREMDELIRGINQKLGKSVVLAVPVGQAILKLRERVIAGTVPGVKTQAELFTDDLGHPKPVLNVLLAYAHFGVIYRSSPVGLPLPKALQEMKLPVEEANALNKLLQELAWDAIIQHPLSGLKQ